LPDEAPVECIEMEGIDGGEYLRQFARTAKRGRVPLSGAIALTHRCNLECAHCYLTGGMRGAEKRARELDAGRVCSLIDEIADAGCLFLLLTGGEPMLRGDFADIYRHAKSRGLLTSVFTNGTLIDREIAQLFSEFPPRSVEISLYGATAETYEKVCGVRGSFAKCMRGVRHLLDRRIRVKLKSVVMTHNVHELPAIEEIARRAGVPFRFDAAIFPRLDGDRGPIALRIPPEEAVAREMAVDGRREEWAAYYARRRDLPETDKLYTCGAGVTNFYVDPYGFLQPCSMTTDVRYGLSGGDFLTAWRDALPRFRERSADPSYECNRCETRVLCGLCPAFFRLESGSETVRSEYLCRMGKLRFRAIGMSGKIS
jgi:radical SAM protein with 4Fe4S-binding SPASM domain